MYLKEEQYRFVSHIGYKYSIKVDLFLYRSSTMYSVARTDRQTDDSMMSMQYNRLLVPPAKRSTVGSRAFPIAGPKTWNAQPEDVISFQSEYTFHRQLKTWL